MRAYINRCENNHCWISSDRCPFCNKKAIEKIEMQQGDCVSCGQLCPVYAYCCTNPAPIEEADLYLIPEDKDPDDCNNS